MDKEEIWKRQKVKVECKRKAVELEEQAKVAGEQAKVAEELANVAWEQVRHKRQLFGLE